MRFALTDKQAAIMAVLEAAAAVGGKCPKDSDIAGAIGLRPKKTADLVLGLRKAGLIRIERAGTCRVIVISATGHRTAPSEPRKQVAVHKEKDLYCPDEWPCDYSAQNLRVKPAPAVVGAPW